ncbi:MAG TPA: hypothetical protein DCZ12_03505 [Gammaproteobacteria bacterium]|nr:hypothetical protein [Gammaproteobacteria bacterium]
MNKQRQKEIDDLRARIEALQAEEQREAEQKKAIEDLHAQLEKGLEKVGISLDEYVKANIKLYKKAVAMAENKAVAKAKRSSGSSIKIPAGRYGNIPSAPGKVFQVKEKGPRPKAVKAYAEEVGVDVFLSQCKLG